MYKTLQTVWKNALLILCHCFQNGVETDEVNVDDGDVQIILNPEVRKLK